MIKDIGTEGLKAGSVRYEKPDVVKKGNYYENTYMFTVRKITNKSKDLS